MNVTTSKKTTSDELLLKQTTRLAVGNERYNEQKLDFT